jgi:hypothetical protein
MPSLQLLIFIPAKCSLDRNIIAHLVSQLMTNGLSKRPQLVDGELALSGDAAGE